MDPDPAPESGPETQDVETLFEPQIYDPDKGSLTLKVFTAVLTDDKVVADPEGLKHWKSDAGDIFWYVQFVNSGQLDVAMNIANDKETAGAELEVEIAGQKLSAQTPFTGGFDTFEQVSLGSVNIDEDGKIKVMLRVKSMNGETAGKLMSVELSGPAAEGSEEERIPRDIAPTILQMKEGVQYDMVYNSVTPILSYMGTSFTVCGCTGPVLSLCDTNCEGVKSISFGMNDDTFVFPWKLNETYHFLVSAVRQSDSTSVDFTAYVYNNEEAKWQLIGSQEEVTEDTSLIQGPWCQLSQSYGLQQGFFPREAFFGPMWGRVLGGQWEELSDATFVFCKYSHDNGDATFKDCRFRVRTGGDTEMNTQPGTVLSARKTGEIPDILKDIESKLPE